MASKGPRGNVKLVSTAKINGRLTGYYYTTTINAKTRKINGLGKLVLKKYDPKAKKHVEFKEEKIKS